MKNEKGITLIILVITVAVLLILVSVSVYVGLANTKESEEELLKTEANMVKNAVITQYGKYKTTKDKSYLIGKEVSDDEISKIIGRKYTSDTDEEKFYELSEEDVKTIGINNARNKYIINYSGDIIVKQLNNEYYVDVSEKSGI